MKRSYIVAFLIAFVTTAWIVSGFLWPSAEPQAAQEADAVDAAATPSPAVPAKTAAGAAKAPFRVGVLDSVAVTRTRSITLRGQTEAERQVVVSAQIPGAVSEVLAEKGAFLRQGDPIVRLDDADRKARLNEARALLAQRQAELKASGALAAKGYAPKLDMPDLKAKLALAEAQVAAMQVEIARSTVLAPIEGLLDERPAELGAFLTTGAPVAIMVDLDPILLVGSIPGGDVGRIAVGDPVSARLIDGRVLEGKVRFIAASAEATTRTFRIEIAAANPDNAVKQGISAEMSIPIEEKPAHRISPAVLTLSESGETGVKIVDAENRVAFVPVEILGEDESGLWVAGLPQQARIIVLGQDFVTVGQNVQTQPALP